MSSLIKLITVYGRELQINLLLMAQSCFNLDRYILDNSSCIGSFSIGHNSASEIQKAMNLTDDELRMLQNLPRGVLAFLRRSITQKSVLVKVHNYSLKSISQDERDRIMEARLTFLREKYLIKFQDDEVRETINDNSNEGLNVDEMHILKDIAINPYDTLAERSSRLGYSSSTVFRHINALEQQEYLEEYKVTLGKGNGVIKLYKLKEKGISLAGKQNLVGRGSIVHGFWMQRIKKYHEKQHEKVEVEKHYSEVNGLIDVAVSGKDNEKLIAVEIALSNKFSHEADNIEKCLKAGFHKVISACVNENILRGIKKEVLNRALQMEKIEFTLLKEFYNGRRAREE